MPPGQRLQFAVVREDPAVELAALAGSQAPRVLLVASGGCTALALQARFPDATFTLVDPNPAQHAHVAAKADAWARGDLAALNVGTDDPAGLNERGNFEALFRQVRRFLAEFVADAPHPGMVASPWWPVAFELFFSDAMLRAMFGPAAVQHAAPGSYVRYFRAVYERMLAAPPSPFSAHVLRGRYDEDALPDYLRHAPVPTRFVPLLGTLQHVPDFGEYDLVHLSNVLDWTEPEAADALTTRVARELRPGAAVTVRQLNNARPIPLPGVDVREVPDEGSFFYTRTLIGRKA